MTHPALAEFSAGSMLKLNGTWGTSKLCLSWQRPLIYKGKVSPDHCLRLVPGALTGNAKGSGEGRISEDLEKKAGTIPLALG